MKRRQCRQQTASADAKLRNNKFLDWHAAATQQAGLASPTDLARVYGGKEQIIGCMPSPGSPDTHIKDRLDVSWGSAQPFPHSVWITRPLLSLMFETYESQKN